MEENIYRKIQLCRTYNLVEDNDKFQEIKDRVENVLKENAMEYVFEIFENKNVSSGKIRKTLYSLNLIIKNEKLDVVKELLDRMEGIEYTVIEEKEIITESIEEEPIKNVISDHTERDNKVGIFSRIFFTFICVSIIIFEVAMFIYVIFEEEYTSSIWLLLIIIIEIPIIKKVWASLEKRKGE